MTKVPWPAADCMSTMSADHLRAVIHDVKAQARLSRRNRIETRAVITNHQNSTSVGLRKSDQNALGLAVLDGVIYGLMRDVVQVIRHACIAVRIGSGHSKRQPIRNTLLTSPAHRSSGVIRPRASETTGTSPRASSRVF